jgi:tetratricopeptide (TPR) repeat protein
VVLTSVPSRIEGAIIVCSRKLSLAVGFTLLLAGPVFAASQQDWNACQGKDPATAIPACSRIIPDQNEPPQSRADAYVFRASAYLAQGDNDHAITDYTEALKLTPRNVVAYLSRALAYSRKGDNERAILDYSIANKIDANTAAQTAAANPEVQKIAAAAQASPPPASALALIDQLPMVGAPWTPPATARQETPPPPPPPPAPLWNSVASAIWKSRGRVHVAVGYSGTRQTADGARESAIQACENAGGRGCKAIGAWNSGCAYITTGVANTRAGWGSGDSIEAARRKCRSQGLDCKEPIGGCVE